jgi:hypothetical protein
MITLPVMRVGKRHGIISGKRKTYAREKNLAIKKKQKKQQNNGRLSGIATQ